ncbi:uncharacterized protein LOC128222299 [Mya arenaria]|uniref:uncharacterized protein LOC128222299 n=1 Tax=Mya arenaria TaxID=6604 RepID=UPI0022E7A2D5|nr:uncharacterized protein LOC128222299 [Mya arenaria]
MDVLGSIQEVLRCLTIFLLMQQVESAGPVCMSCSRLPLPSDCSHVISCGGYQSCLTRQFVSPSGTIFFDTGCFDTAKCGTKRSTSSNDTFHADAYDVSGDVITCVECCQDNYCNIKGCGSTPPVPLNVRGPLCFRCDTTESPDGCETVTTCGKDQVCYIESYINPLNGQERYRSGCRSVSMCGGSVINDSSTSEMPCDSCCSWDFCNRGQIKSNPTNLPQTPGCQTYTGTCQDFPGCSSPYLGQFICEDTDMLGGKFCPALCRCCETCRLLL